MGLPGIRDLYNRFERVAGPLAEQVVKTEEFAQAAAPQPRRLTLI